MDINPNPPKISAMRWVIFRENIFAATGSRKATAAANKL